MKTFQTGFQKEKFDLTMHEIVFAELHIGRWRGKSRINEDELGIPEKLDAGLFKLGVKILYPTIPPYSKFYTRGKSITYADVLESIEQSARAYLRDNTIQLGNWGRAMRVTEAEKFADEMRTRYADRYFAVRTELVQNWDELTASVVQEYRAALTSAKARWSKLNGNGDFDIDEFVQRASKLIPTKEEFMDSFQFRLDFRFFDVAAWVGDSAREFALEELLQNPKYAAERKAYEEALEARRRIAGRNAAELEEAQKQLARAIIEQTRLILYDNAVKILESMQKNDRELHSGAVIQLKTMAELADKFTFLCDSEAVEIRKAIQNLVALGSDRTAGDVQSILTAVATLARDTLLSYNVKPRETSVAIPTEPGDFEVKRARQIIQEFNAEMEALNELTRKRE